MICAIAAAVVACGRKQEIAVQPPAQPAVAAVPQPLTASLTGKVIETLDAGGYTYLHLSTANGEQWAAVPQAKVANGATVNVAVQMAMEKFESKTLKRTFDKVLFGTIATENAPAIPTRHPAVAVTPDGGKTIAQVWSEKAALKDKPVIVRGKVVKFLPGIMGRNWMHLRDGDDTDLTVTTSDTAAVGDIVTIKGVVHLDKDFGAGYTYAVIIEDASIVK
jgi:hypothetical protein